MSVNKSPATQLCPDEVIAKVFASVYFAILKRGTKNEDGSYSIDWTFFKSYCRRIFEEPPIRVENAVHIFIKMKLARFEIGKPPENPKGPDVILKLHFTDINCIENFFEFYQYNYFNPGKKSFLEYDDIAINLSETLVDEASKVQPDRHGKAHVAFKTISDSYTARTGAVIVPAHIQHLETKGIFCKLRNLEDKGVTVEFEAKEIQNILYSWKILREIKKWNQKGSVDPNEVEKVQKKVALTGVCPACGAAKVSDARFCHACGAKIP